MAENNKGNNLPKLPAIFNTEANRRFFDATVDQLLSPKDSEKLNAYIGRRVSGAYAPTDDYYKEEQSKERTWNQLEPIAYSKNPHTLEDTNHLFYDDMVNRINYLGGLTGNHDRLFSGEYHSYSPGIDFDKFVNYVNYFWIPDRLPVIEISGMDDAQIEELIVGKTHFNTGDVDGVVPSGAEFTSGVRVKFTDANAYNRDLTVESVGRSIMLVPDYLDDVAITRDEFIPWDDVGAPWDFYSWESVQKEITEDYITMERMSYDGNAWSRTNKWYHKDVITVVSAFTDFVVDTSAQRAQRPIIEFKRDIEMYNSGGRFLGEIDNMTDKPLRYSDDPCFVNPDLENPPVIDPSPDCDPYGYLDGIDGAVADTLKGAIDGEDAVHGKTIAFIEPRDGVIEPRIFYMDIQNTEPTQRGIKAIKVVKSGSGYSKASKIDLTDISEVGGTAQPVIDVIGSIELVDGGTGYQEGHVDVTISDPRGVGTGATAVARVDGLSSINIDKKGGGYTTATVTIIDSSGRGKGATASANVVNGKVMSIDVTGAGKGYSTKTTTIKIEGDGTGAKAVPVISSIGTLNITAGGTGYTVSPIVEITSRSGMGTGASAIANVDGISSVIVKGAKKYTDASVALSRNGGSGEDAILEVMYDTVLVNITPVVNLREMTPLPVDGDTILIRGGDRYGRMSFIAQGGRWTEVFNDKEAENQPPLFNLYDNQGVPLSNYPSNDFEGNKIFSYKENENSAFDDPVLGFPLEYASVGQASDIVYENNIYSETYHTTFNAVIEGYYYYKEMNPSPLYLTQTIEHRSSMGETEYVPRTLEPTLENSWQTSTEHNKQRVVDHLMGIAGERIYEISVPPRYDESTGVVDINVLIQGKAVDDFEYIPQGKLHFIKFGESVPIADNDSIVFETFTWGDLSDDSGGYFEIPPQLENNPNYDEVYEYTGTSLTEHFTSIMKNQPTFSGSALGGSNNYRDTSKDETLGDKIIQTHSSLLKGMMISSSTDLDIVESVRFSQREYIRFKNKFISQIAQLMNSNFNPFVASDRTVIDEWMSEILERIANTTEYQGAFLNSFMIGNRDVYESYPQGMLRYDSAIVIKTTIDPREHNNFLYIYDGDKILTERLEYEVTSYDGTTLIITMKYDSTDSCTVRLYNDPVQDPIPPTPSKLGCHRLFVPDYYIDTSFTDEIWMMRGHDGSTHPLYGGVDDNGLIDIRDKLIYELETRIHNNVNSRFQEVEYAPLLTIFDVLEGRYRQYKRKYNDGNDREGLVRYSREEYNEVSKSLFYRWANLNNANFRANDYYDPSNWKSWNYRDIVVDGRNLEGNWKGIYYFYFDTAKPNTAPWEMLGFTERPLWWDGVYGHGPYTDGTNEPLHAMMWEDLEAGIIRSGEREGVEERFARPGMPVPVTIDGELKPIFELLGIQDTLLPDQKKKEWVYGDRGPVEDTWYRSSDYPFSLMEILYLMRPADFGEQLWDTERAKILTSVGNEYINSDDYERSGTDELLVHGENVSDSIVYRNGYQHWISDRLTFNLRSLSNDFGDVVRGMQTELGHKLGGFTNRDTLNVFLEGVSTTSTATSLQIPQEDVSVELFTGATKHEYVLGGILVKLVDAEKRHYLVQGYDLLEHAFKVLKRDYSGRSREVTVGGVASNYTNFMLGQTYKVGNIVYNNSYYHKCTVEHVAIKFDEANWDKLPSLPITGGITVDYYLDNTGEMELVEYNTVFKNEQDVYNFILSYGDWLESEGWLFETIDTDTNTRKDWLDSANQFLFWANNAWSVDNSIALMPDAKEVKLVVSEGYPSKIERVSNGVYSILDKNGIAIPPNDTLINRDNRYITVRHKDQRVGIYGVRVATKETEHIITFNNTTQFNDIIFDPLLGVRQSRLRFSGFRTNGWIGKLEAGGYLIGEDGITVNYENLTDSVSKYFDTETDLDLAQFDLTAKHLIGYENREYMDNLEIIDDTQYQFYQGMIREKGTESSINRLLRAKNVAGTEGIDVFGEWAFKIGDFGATQTTFEKEFLIRNNDLRTDPQVVRFHTEYDDSIVEDLEYDSIIDIDIDDTERWIKRPDKFLDNLFTGVNGEYNPSNPVLNTMEWIPMTDKTYFGIPSAGYVHLLDVDRQLYDLEEVMDASYNYEITASQESLNISIASAIPTGDKSLIWIASDARERWGVYDFFDNTGVSGLTENELSTFAEISVDSSKFLGFDVNEKIRRYYETNFIYDEGDVVSDGVVRITIIDPELIANSQIVYQRTHKFEMNEDGTAYVLLDADLNPVVYSEVFGDFGVSIDTVGYEIMLNQRFDDEYEFISYKNDQFEATEVSSINQYAWIDNSTGNNARATVAIRGGYVTDVCTVETTSSDDPCYLSGASAGSGFDGTVASFHEIVKGSALPDEFALYEQMDTFVDGSLGTINVLESGTGYFKDDLTVFSTIWSPSDNNLPIDTTARIYQSQTESINGQALAEIFYNSVSDIAVDDGGSGYHSETTTVTIDGDSFTSQATASEIVVKGGIAEPVSNPYPESTFEYSDAVQGAVVGDGTGGTIEVTINGSVYRVVVVDGGTEYVNGGAVTFTAQSGDTGTGGSGTLVVSGGIITSITVENGGSGYAVPPLVNLPTTTGDNAIVFTEIRGKIPSDGITVVANSEGTGYLSSNTTYVISDSVTNNTETYVDVPVSGEIVEITVGNPGKGYISADVVITGGAGDATATATVHDGLYRIDVTDGGDEYDDTGEPPHVGIYDGLVVDDETYEGEGYGAKAVATIVDGKVSSIEITESGQDYENPFVLIESPTGFAEGERRRTTLVPILVTGELEQIDMVFNGDGYASEPDIYVRDMAGEGSGAIASVRMTDDTVSEIFLEDGGSGYVDPHVFISSPERKADWVVLDEFDSTVHRQQEQLIASDFYQNAFMYDYDTHATIALLPVYDPYKGLIIGQADQNITFKTHGDPTTYTNSITDILVDPENAFGKDELGLLWWDLSTAKFILYEQGDIDYRRRHWGELFPGSSIDIYEWVSSPNPPSEWELDGTPRNATDFVFREHYNIFKEKHEGTYFFWVKNRTVTPDSVLRRNRTMSGFDVAKTITNPNLLGFPWFSPISAGQTDDAISNNAYIFANIDYAVSNRDVSFQINYKMTEKDTRVHNEWTLLREGDTQPDIPLQLWEKMVDSLVGKDNVGNEVPDPHLTEVEKYGTQFRPRQSWFKDMNAAREIFVQASNTLLKEINIRDTNPNWNDNISSELYWHYIDWYADGYDFETVIPSREVANVRDISALTDLRDGEIIRVSGERYSHYVYHVENNSTTLINREDSAIELLDTIFDEEIIVMFGIDNNELRLLLQAFRDEIFVGEYEIDVNLLFFSMINYVVSEQVEIDWVFKTTYVKAKQDGKVLEQNLHYQPDAFENTLQYFNEVKPYHSKIREYQVSYKVVDVAEGTAVDFKNDKIKLIFDRVCQNQTSNVVDSVVVTNGGSGYILPPSVRFINDVNNQSGTGVTAVSIITGIGTIVYKPSDLGSGFNHTTVAKVVGDGIDAEVLLNINSTVISEIKVVNQGSGYNTDTTLIEIYANGSATPTHSVGIGGTVPNSEVRADAVSRVDILTGGSNYNIPPAIQFVKDQAADVVSAEGYSTVKAILCEDGQCDFEGTIYDGGLFNDAYGWDMVAWDDTPWEMRLSDNETNIDLAEGEDWETNKYEFYRPPYIADQYSLDELTGNQLDVGLNGQTRLDVVTGEKIADGGSFLQPGWSTCQPEELVPYDVGETLSIIVDSFYPNKVEPLNISYRLFKDSVFGSDQFYRNADARQSTILATDDIVNPFSAPSSPEDEMILYPDNILQKTPINHDEIYVADISIFSPLRDSTEYAWIGHEKISYRGVDEERGVLTGVMRGVEGSRVSEHPTGTKIYYAGRSEIILNARNRIFHQIVQNSGYIRDIEFIYNNGKVLSVSVENGGVGYSQTTAVEIAAPDSPAPYGINATADAVVDNKGRIIEVIITEEGRGYDTPPQITFVDDLGDGNATASATTLSNDGQLTDTVILNDGGIGYGSVSGLKVDDYDLVANSPSGIDKGGVISIEADDGAIVAVTIDNPGLGYEVPIVEYIPSVNHETFSYRTLYDSADDFTDVSPSIPRTSQAEFLRNEPGNVNDTTIIAIPIVVDAEINEVSGKWFVSVLASGGTGRKKVTWQAVSPDTEVKRLDNTRIAVTKNSISNIVNQVVRVIVEDEQSVSFKDIVLKNTDINDDK